MAGRPYILAETNWKTVKATDYEVAVLPWGATEAHNYHLPYSTDVVQCDEIAAEAARIAWAREAKVVVLPTVPFGVNTGQLDIKLDLNLNPSTQLAVLGDLVEALEHQNIPKLLIMNGHGGNDFKQMVRELLPRYEVFICCMDWFNTVPDGLFVEDGDHADEMETSMMQYLRPDWGLPLSEAGDGYEHKFKIAALKEGWVWTQRDWTRATADTGIGNPHLATPDKGKRCLQQAGAQIAEFLVDFAAADVDDLYE
jgi:creatinine amidohydrolase